MPSQCTSEAPTHFKLQVRSVTLPYASMKRSTAMLSVVVDYRLLDWRVKRSDGSRGTGVRVHPRNATYDLWIAEELLGETQALKIDGAALKTLDAEIEGAFAASDSGCQFRGWRRSARPPRSRVTSSRHSKNCLDRKSVV